MRRTHVYVLVLMLMAQVAVAQRPAPGNDTVLKGSTIEIIQSYKPKVKQSPKPEWKPQLPPVDTAHPALTFTVPQQTLYYTYTSTPVRPLALGKTANELPYPNYVKVGGGNLSTAYLDAGIGSIKGHDYETGIHLHHISQKGKIINQQSALSGIDLEGMLHKKAHDWRATATGSRNQYAYYGYDHNLYSYNKNDVTQTYTSVKIGVDVANRQDTNTAFTYHPAVNASYYAAKNNTSEITMGFNAPITYQLFDALSLHLGLSGAYTNYKADTISTNNNYLAALPGVKVQLKNFYAHALGGFGYGKGGSTYFLPDIVATFGLPLIEMKASIGWKGTLRQNTFEQLSTENPYMLSPYTVIQTKRDEIYAEATGSGGEHFTYSARVSWWNFFDLPTFLNDTGDQKQLYILYQNTNAFSFQVSTRYHVAKLWSAGVTADVFSFYNSTDQFVWHEPTTRIKADVAVKIHPKIDLSAYATILGGIHARDTAYNAITLRTIADIGVSGEYSFIPRLSVFLQLNNLLNSNYQRWYGYQAYGFNIYGGLRLKF